MTCNHRPAACKTLVFGVDPAVTKPGGAVLLDHSLPMQTPAQCRGALVAHWGWKSPVGMLKGGTDVLGQVVAQAIHEAQRLRAEAELHGQDIRFVVRCEAQWEGEFFKSAIGPACASGAWFPLAFLGTVPGWTEWLLPSEWRSRVGFPRGHDAAKAYAWAFARQMLGADCGLTVDEAEGFGLAFAPVVEREAVQPVKRKPLRRPT